MWAQEIKNSQNIAIIIVLSWSYVPWQLFIVIGLYMYICFFYISLARRNRASFIFNKHNETISLLSDQCDKICSI